MKSHILIAAKGFCMGAADVIPGVSGGTMAFILGIYRRLLEAIRAFDVKLVQLVLHREIRAAIQHTDVTFLLPLGLGIFAALMFFTRVVPLPTLIHTHPELIYGLFFGLIVASIIVLLRALEKLGALDTLLLFMGALVGLGIVNLVPMNTPESNWFIFLSGAIAICAMILPGISGSFILLMLKKYAYVFDAVGRFDLGVILPFAVGAIFGLMLFSRALTWLLDHYYQRTLVTIVGLLTGSLWVIWPFQERTYEVVRGKSRLVHSAPVWPVEWSNSVLSAVAFMVVGLSIVLVLHALSERKTASA